MLRHVSAHVGKAFSLLPESHTSELKGLRHPQLQTLHFTFEEEAQRGSEWPEARGPASSCPYILKTQAGMYKSSHLPVFSFALIKPCSSPLCALEADLSGFRAFGFHLDLAIGRHL